MSRVLPSNEHDGPLQDKVFMYVRSASVRDGFAVVWFAKLAYQYSDRVAPDGKKYTDIRREYVEDYGDAVKLYNATVKKLKAWFVAEELKS